MSALCTVPVVAGCIPRWGVLHLEEVLGLRSIGPPGVTLDSWIWEQEADTEGSPDAW